MSATKDAALRWTLDRLIDAKNVCYGGVTLEEIEQREALLKDDPVKPAVGWAVVFFGEMDVRTISPTRRAAIINWIVSRGGKWVSNNTTDDEIESMWKAFVYDNNDLLTAVEVNVEVRR
jgi:hypothetical protein